MPFAESPAVLVVDDNREITRMLSRNLGGANVRVITAASGLECFQALSATRIDLILLDIRLPDFNGWGILSLLRLTEPLCHIPVIMVSGEAPDPDLLRQLKPEYYIRKPFDMQDLLQRVEKIIDAREIGICR
ncbi:MAG: response regulator [Chloroflexota bacterium]